MTALIIAAAGIAQSLVLAALIWRHRHEILSGHAVLYPASYQ